MVMDEGLRLWSPWDGAPLATLLLLTMAGPLIAAGMAG